MKFKFIWVPAFKSSLERILYEVNIPMGTLFFTFIGRITRLPKPLMSLLIDIWHIDFFNIVLTCSIWALLLLMITMVGLIIYFIYYLYDYLVPFLNIN